MTGQVYVVGNSKRLDAHIEKLKGDVKVIRVSEENYKEVTKDGDIICMQIGETVITFARNIKFEER